MNLPSTQPNEVPTSQPPERMSPVVAPELSANIEPPPSRILVSDAHVLNTIRFFTEPKLRYRTVYKIGLPDRRRHQVAVSLDVQIPKKLEHASEKPEPAAAVENLEHPAADKLDTRQLKYVVVPVAMVPIALLSQFDLRDGHETALFILS